jgi:hypothetical protein
VEAAQPPDCTDDPVHEEVSHLTYGLQLSPQSGARPAPSGCPVLPREEHLPREETVLERVEANGGLASAVLGPVCLRAFRRFASAFLALVTHSSLRFVMTASSGLYSERSPFQAARRCARRDPE